MLYKIKWHVIKDPSKTGERSPTTKELAETWAKWGNEKYPEIKHVAVPVDGQ